MNPFFLSIWQDLFLKKNQKILFLFFLFLTSFFSASNLFSQTEPFSKITIGLSAARQGNSTLLNEFWNNNFALEGSFESPFYFGEVKTGLVFLPFEGNSVKYPNFKIFYFYLGWDGVLHFYDNFAASFGVSAGSSLMYFHADEIAAFEKTESELAFSTGAKIKYQIAGKFGIFSKIDLIKIFTKNNIDLMLISAGVDFTIDTPKWLESFLK